MIINIDTFKGANLELVNKVFVIGPAQASKYDEAYKVLITYFGSTFDHRVSRAFEQKDSDVGRIMLILPSVLMIDKVVQIATEGNNSKLVERVKSVIDKNGESFIIYQIQLK